MAPRDEVDDEDAEDTEEGSGAEREISDRERFMMESRKGRGDGGEGGTASSQVFFSAVLIRCTREKTGTGDPVPCVSALSVDPDQSGRAHLAASLR